jgi:hypothetical protein
MRVHLHQHTHSTSTRSNVSHHPRTVSVARGPCDTIAQRGLWEGWHMRIQHSNDEEAEGTVSE